MLKGKTDVKNQIMVSKRSKRNRFIVKMHTCDGGNAVCRECHLHEPACE